MIFSLNLTDINIIKRKRNVYIHEHSFNSYNLNNITIFYDKK